MANAPLDCIIVGYNDVDFRQVVDEYRATQSSTGAYHYIRRNSVLLAGRHTTYMELLNRALEKNSGRNPQLHVAKMPSLGAWHLRSYLVQNGYRAEVVNSFNFDKQQFLALLAQKPRCVAITTTFYLDAKPIGEIAQWVRKHAPDTRIVVGGPHIYNVFEAYGDDDETLQYLMKEELGVDICIVDSQGELTLSRVVSHLRGESHAHETAVEVSTGRRKTNSLTVVSDTQVRTDSLASIPNLAFIENGRFVRTPRVIESNDMDVFNTSWADVPSERFVPTVPTRTARSCAFSCAFCRYPVLAGPLNLTGLDAVKRQFDLFQARGVKQVVIIDDTFNVPLPRFKELLRMIIRERYDFEWYSYFRAANADDECFDLMAQSKCGGVFLGIESGDQTILNNMNKSVRVDRYVHGIRELNARGIITFACLIVGFPGESDETVRNTIRFLEEARPTFYRAELYYHGKNTPIHERAREFEIRGSGFGWRHKTMEWKAACSHIDRMYQTVSSTVLPIYMFDFWGIPYLLGNGITKRQFHDFTRAAQTLLLDDLTGKAPKGDGQRIELLAAALRGAADSADASDAVPVAAATVA